MTYSKLPIILASTSPRRHELLNQIHIEHTCIAVSINEAQLSDEPAIAYIERMVKEKANAALAIIAKNVSECLVITADTIGVLPDGQVLQKPINYADAYAMWQQMSGNTHQVWTAVQISRIQKTKDSFQLTWQKHITVKTQVNFIILTESMMQAYWQTGEPQDKAGGYAIQGQGAAWVKWINGSYSNVVGLPLAEVKALIDEAINLN